MNTLSSALIVTMLTLTSFAAGDLQRSAMDFPNIAVWGYRPDMAVEVANNFIMAGPSNAITALEGIVYGQRMFPVKHEDGEKICHLCRLLFVPNSPNKTLRAPGLGAPDLWPYKSMRTSDWPYMPFAIVDDVPLSVTTGYILAGRAETATEYLAYCRRNGVVRTKPYPVPTVSIVSNALEKLFVSPAWSTLKWKDSGPSWSYTLNEDWVKKSLRKQIENMRIGSP